MFTVEVQYFIRRHVYDFSMVSALLSLWVQRSLFIYSWIAPVILSLFSMPSENIMEYRKY